MRNRFHMLHTTALPRVGLHGRLMKDGEGHGGASGGAPAGDSGFGGNNQQGNSGAGGGNAPNQNYNGQGFDPSQFWVDPPAQDAPPARGSAGNESSGGGSPQNQGDQAGQRFAQMIQQAQFDSNVFTPEALTALNENSDLTAVNNNMAKFGQSVMRQTTLLAAQLMQAFGNQMEAKFESMLNQQFDGREADADLVRSIPSAANPAVAPMVKAIFKRALGISKGDRKAAIDMTKEMLKFQSQSMSGDLGLDVPPRSDDSIPASNVNWVEELVGRS